jgi:16S rRNA (uracil1498-N3)-methyltransferase
VKRIPVPAGSLRVGPYALPEEESRRIRDVLRLEPGAEVEHFDGAGVAARAKLTALGLQVQAEVLELRAPPKAPPLCIAQGLPKADKLELVIQKATELGAAEVVPFAAARSVVRLDAGKAHGRVERWRKIALEAARQCGRADALAVGELSSLDAVLERPGARGLLYEGATEVRLGAFLDAAGEQPVTLIVGPEGGFADEEVARAKEKGAALVGLGPRILRTETVALAALAVALHRRGELG